jgi:hypothetical protein
MKTHIKNLYIVLSILGILSGTLKAQTYSGYTVQLSNFGMFFQDVNLNADSHRAPIGTFSSGTASVSLQIDSVNQTITESGSWSISPFTTTYTFPASYSVTQPPVFPNPPVTTTYTGSETVTFSLANPVSGTFNSGPLPLTFAGGTTYSAPAFFSSQTVNATVTIDVSILGSDGVTHTESQITQVLALRYDGARTVIDTATYPGDIDPVTLAGGIHSGPIQTFNFQAYTDSNGMSFAPQVQVPEPTAGLLVFLAIPFVLLRRFRKASVFKPAGS